MDKVDIEHVVSSDTVDNEKAALSTAYTGDHLTNVRYKSPTERKLVLKAQVLIATLAALVYFVAYLDRNSIGNARIMGLQKDLKLTSKQYYNILTMFFVGYIIFMLPGNILLRYVSPNRMIGGSVLAFGAIVCGMAGAQNYQTLLALRILVGFAQAFIQGLSVYTSLWFKRNEIATVGAIYYSAATIAGAFSGLIAYGVQKDLTKASTGRAPWRWLFIIEGTMAMGVGVLTCLCLPGFPDKLKGRKHWLFTPEEIELACERAATYNTIGAKVVPKQIWIALKDPKTWAFAMIQAGVATGVGTVGVFLPSFVKAFGYSTLQTQLFSVIPYACAFVTVLSVATISDRLNKKGVFLAASVSVACVGYIILLNDVTVHVKVFATCLVTSGLYPAVILVATWVSMNTGGFTKRGTTWAIAEISGQSFSIMGTHVYTDPPRYIKGHSVVLAFMLLALLSTVFLIVWMNRLNQQRDRTQNEYQARGELHPHATKSLEEEYDSHISFRYIL